MPLHVRESMLADVDAERETSYIAIRKPEDVAFVKALVEKVRVLVPAVFQDA